MTKARTNADNGDTVGRVLLSTTSLIGTTTANITVPGGYRDLFVEMTGAYTPTDGDKFRFRVNSDTGANYYGGTVEAVTNTMDTYLEWTSSGHASDATKAQWQKTTILIDDYAETKVFKRIKLLAMGYFAAVSANTRRYDLVYYYYPTTPVTSVNIFNASGGTFTAGSVKIYGIK